MLTNILHVIKLLIILNLALYLKNVAYHKNKWNKIKNVNSRKFISSYSKHHICHNNNISKPCIT